jgi:hypothetical protein
MEQNKKHNDHAHQNNSKPTILVLLHHSLGRSYLASAKWREIVERDDDVSAEGERRSYLLTASHAIKRRDYLVREEEATHAFAWTKKKTESGRRPLIKRRGTAEVHMCRRGVRLSGAVRQPLLLFATPS